MADDDEEDWFERALREEDGESEESEDEAREAGDEPAEPAETADAGDVDADGSAEGESAPAADSEFDFDTEPEPEAEPEPEPGPDAESESASESEPDAESEPASDDEFADAFATDTAEEPAGSESAGEFGMGESEPASDDEFADAFGGGGGGGGGGGEFGFDLDEGGSGGDGGGGGFGFDLGGDGSPGGAAEEEFDEAFETNIPRIDLGIEGLDAMVQGGVPDRSLIVAIGSAGTGKTTFGLQFLNQAIENDERGVYITLEETRERIVQSASEKGWPFEEYIERGDLAVVDLDPVEMANSLKNIRNELPALIEDFGASRLVLDSVSLLEMMYDDQAVRRTEIYDFTKALKKAGVTTMLTSEASDDNAFSSRYGIIEYLTDAVIVLRYVRPEDFRETRLAIEIQKIRDANHSRETKPYEITNNGISVYRQANIF
ncbi:KaiC domain-containing protein [Halocalculus aciditolerans]|uniref:KaiC domain-containing protein n=1 Tax=Halocalculus aciditolerans TaxID=1383812 RepID=A0A830FGC5_9EURY|nr:KaiC domain-containing protein [Halocalculus aciditolerans]GGL50391.1 hypothetical protein GCM10009039_05660 [Halocalculus aciditolerans]